MKHNYFLNNWKWTLLHYSESQKNISGKINMRIVVDRKLNGEEGKNEKDYIKKKM